MERFVSGRHHALTAASQWPEVRGLTSPRLHGVVDRDGGSTACFGAEGRCLQLCRESELMVSSAAGLRTPVGPLLHVPLGALLSVVLTVLLLTVRALRLRQVGVALLEALVEELVRSRVPEGVRDTRWPVARPVETDDGAIKCAVVLMVHLAESVNTSQVRSSQVTSQVRSGQVKSSPIE